MTDYEVGDTVRVTSTYVGEVLDRDSTTVRIQDYGWFNANEDETTIEVIEKRKPKVGDVLNSREGLFKLSPDSVVVNAFGHPLIVTSSTTLLTREGSTIRPTDRVFSASPYTISHIPDWAK